MFSRQILAVICATTFIGLNHASAQEAPVCEDDVAVFPAVDASIRLEIADDPQERAQGLMNREGLAPMTGMLFIYESPRPASFWMKNTLIPLDMIFMDAQGVIRHIHPSAKPGDLTPIPGHTADDPDPNRLMVLEVGGGESERIGLEVGMAMAFPRLDQSMAAQPCR
ncbi:DUF192 domain-containing protein [Paracoccus albus]|uniref:DUF192 domain-containing protein n=1 Tax=Paracoccus albus TaxID=3017784 RepID=UPI0022F0D4B5|nr:DUF192 domain-containing protein [Paracoccus albus]WBU59015.1 DUF192 domain-containing protein [Paracoccus albus]